MAEFETKCPHCQSILNVQEEWIGMEVECPTCNKNFPVQRISVPVPPPGGSPQFGQVPQPPVNTSPNGFDPGSGNPGFNGNYPGGGPNYGQIPYVPQNSFWSQMKQYLSFSSPDYGNLNGRISVKQFWILYLLLFVVGSIIIVLAGGLIGGLIGGIYAAATKQTEYAARFGAQWGGLFGSIFHVIYMVYLFPIFVSLSVRRLHDSNLSGIYAFLWIPFFVYGQLNQRFFTGLFDNFAGNIGFIFFPSLIFILLMCRKGTPGPNQFDEKQ